jgi:hypothetical protein
MASAENVKLEEGRETIQKLTHSSISDQASELALIEKVLDWRKVLIDYLENKTQPSEKKFAV